MVNGKFPCRFFPTVGRVERLGNHGTGVQFFTNCGSRRVQAAHVMQESKIKKKKKYRNLFEPVFFSTGDTVDLGYNATKGTEYLVPL